MPERFWDMQRNKHFETKFKANVDIFFWFTQVGVLASSLPERFWDMQHNKHFEAKFKRNVYLFQVHPG